MAKYQHPTHIADWLRANGINIRHIPVDSDLTITTDEQGQRTVHYEELITNDDDRVISFGGETRTVRRSAPLTVEPPDWWQPYEKPTREQLAAAVERVRALHVRNANTGDCEHCSERDYPDYAVPHPCPTTRALDGEPPPEDTAQCWRKEPHPPHTWTLSPEEGGVDCPGIDQPATEEQPGPDFTSPLTGIEVRDPCPHCGDRQMVPRSQFAEHVARLHPEEQS